ncbi:MAG: Gfo/Idh/MocA family protein [Candidatus Methylomirabilia bacterium]
MDKVRIGMVGTGFAADLHAGNYRFLRGQKVELTAVCGRARESTDRFAERFKIPRVFTDYRALAECSEVDCVDICVPTALHHEVAIAAAAAGKHLIVEKPLTGYFGEGDEPRERMLEGALKNADAVLDAVKRAGVTLCYAEDFVYAPAVGKLKRLIAASGGTVLELRAEESHSGSHATYSGRWKTSGGGSLLRMGSHPVGVVLHLKHYEGQLREGRPIRARSVLADVGQLTRLPRVAAEPRKWMRSEWVDVEDWSTAVITFEDGTKATIRASDITLGGIRNQLTAYLTNAVVEVNINPNTAIQAYTPDPAIFRDEYLTEKVETKAGWQFPSPEEEWMRGFPQELEDFVDALRQGREPVSGAELAREVVEVIYAGYLSAATARGVDLSW